MSVITSDGPQSLLAIRPDRRWLRREDVPVVINSYNRLDCLRELIAWLVRAGQRRLYVIDNASTFPPLLDFLERLEAERVATIVRLGENAGHLAIWRHGILARLGIDSEYVYSDPDVVPADSCPVDVIGLLQSVLAANEPIAVAGLGLRLDDLPDSYRYKSQAIHWERQFWLTPAAPGLFLAPIDTTFALYRPGGGHGLASPSLRTGWPYLACHRSWYVDEARLTDEDLFYRETALRGTSNWAVQSLPDWLAAAADDQARRRPVLVQVTGKGMPLPGYVPAADNGDIALPAASVDGIYVTAEPCQLANNPHLQAELRRVAKPGGQIVVHLGQVDASTLRILLRQDPIWMRGWRLRRAVIAATAPEQPATALMLQLEPVSSNGSEAPPEIRFGELDHWPGFKAVSD